MEIITSRKKFQEFVIGEQWQEGTSHITSCLEYSKKEALDLAKSIEPHLIGRPVMHVLEIFNLSENVIPDEEYWKAQNYLCELAIRKVISKVPKQFCIDTYGFIRGMHQYQDGFKIITHEDLDGMDESYVSKTNWVVVLKWYSVIDGYEDMED